MLCQRGAKPIHRESKPQEVKDVTGKIVTAMLAAGCFLFSPAPDLRAAGDSGLQAEPGAPYLQLAAVTKSKPKRSGKG